MYMQYAQPQLQEQSLLRPTLNFDWQNIYQLPVRVSTNLAVQWLAFCI
jgi:hypothetical protein